MSIVYVRFDVALHGLNLTTTAEMEALRDKIKGLLMEHHPSGYLSLTDSDVEVEITEHAGVPELRKLR